MFSCFFLEGNNKICTPAKCNVEVTCSGFTCTGKALLRIEASHPINDGVLYVPSLLYHPSGARTTLRLTKCNIKKATTSESFHLTETNWHSPDIRIGHISYSEIKASLEKVILNYGAAQSSKDVILYIGNIESTLDIEMNFISILTPSTIITLKPTDKTTIDYYFMAYLPAIETSLSLLMDTPNGTSVCSIRPTNCETSCLTHSLSKTNQVTARLNVSTLKTNNHPPFPPQGIQVSLLSRQPILAVCHTTLMEKPLSVNEHTTCDGIDVVDYMFTPVSNGYQGESSPISTSPAEFVFMIDCSGSMSGSRIQSAAESVLFAVKSLPDTCHFNVIAFGSKFRMLFQSSMAVSYRTVEHGVQFANQLQACLGGTELLTPLRRINKNPPNEGILRHVFLITDGGVPNIPLILQTAVRHRNTTRFHTFALGPDICSELMAGLASETGGQYRVISDDDRLQTKVMEILQACLKPTLQNAKATFSPPGGYVSSPVPHLSFPPHLSPGIVYSRAALINKSSSNTPTDGTTPRSSVVISGNFQQETIEQLTSSFPEEAHSEKAVAMLQVSAWHQLSVLEERLLQPQRPKVSEVSEEESCPPAAKRQRLKEAAQSAHDATREELIKISLMSGVPCSPYTHFKSSSLFLAQVSAWNESKAPPPPPSVRKGHNLMSVNVPISSHRKRPRSSKVASDAPSSLALPSFSLSSLAGRTASGINSVIKTAVNVMSLGLISMEGEEPAIEGGGHRIEDQEYYQNKTDRIHWSKGGDLVFPKFYYTSGEDGNEIEQSSDNTDEKSHSDEELTTSDVNDGQHLPGFDYKIPPHMKLEDCSLQAYYVPLIQMQLPSGAWSLSTAFSAVINVKMIKILELPVSNGHSSHYAGNSGKSQGHVWATALALAFLEVNYSTLRLEWELLAYKGHQWIVLNRDCVPLSLSDINKIALKLVAR